ncbi:DUF3783 domain-containing protein [Clostridium chauvoei]|uniref:DUF3783 domain-containing protein n=2 Tax=Clostridium chauvoei TaxID=46867 RepID=A0A1U6IR95_9CLOT|nr:DUF3783 domain-containing protein [Clostridium chauvoei]ATD53803.1 hypothetical protein BTM20_00360 [Clostridium chauvoei]ATD58390.1 hypothetical protein BTM21_11955 [Clostridium chauvoei]MBX7280440.1 DUF3783 domain-containing protein [Clostridium chauvoei]MBX7282925.1 DUF3783 domain-containing protein [Clostridium chauvoei]MBX7285331.1 DUF3783 domain-containing protein [Clostridium chauvoei]
MLDNNKCILTYRVPEIELKSLENKKMKIIEILPEMTEMKVRDILDGFRFPTFNPYPTKGKIILFNNFSDKELQATITAVRKLVKGGILAVVTPTSIEWKFNDLANHLVEEREWFLNQQKGSL